MVKIKKLSYCMTLPRSDVGWNEDWNLYLYVFDKDLQKCTEMHLPVCLPGSGSKVVGLPLKRLFRRREKKFEKEVGSKDSQLHRNAIT